MQVTRHLSAPAMAHVRQRTQSGTLRGTGVSLGRRFLVSHKVKPTDTTAHKSTKRGRTPQGDRTAVLTAGSGVTTHTGVALASSVQAPCTVLRSRRDGGSAAGSSGRPSRRRSAERDKPSRRARPVVALTPTSGNRSVSGRLPGRQGPREAARGALHSLAVTALPSGSDSWKRPTRLLPAFWGSGGGRARGWRLRTRRRVRSARSSRTDS